MEVCSDLLLGRSQTGREGGKMESVKGKNMKTEGGERKRGKKKKSYGMLL